MIVYAVYEYDYVNSATHGVFSTEEKAQKYIEQVVKGYITERDQDMVRRNMEIQTWEVDNLST